MIFIEIKIKIKHIISVVLIGTCISCVVAPVYNLLCMANKTEWHFGIQVCKFETECKQN